MSADDRAVRRRLRNALEGLYGDRLVKAVLYGSRARGDERPDSDYDVVAFVRDCGRNWPERMRARDAVEPVEDEFGIAVSVNVVPVEDFDRRTMYMRQVREEGVPL